MKPTRDQYRVAIVGAGVIGLFTAYHLLRAGAGPVLVVDRGFLSSGASGRNGGGVRQQWETAATIRLARESVSAYRRFGTEFGYNIWFRQGGYLFLATTDRELVQLQSVHRVVLGEGLGSRIVERSAIPRYAPGLSLDGVVGASFLSTDGTLYPFPVVWGLYEAVRRMGGEVVLGVEATAVARSEGKVSGLELTTGPVRAERVVNAAGGWSGEFSRRAGLSPVNRPTRHEILATEPLKPFLDPMVVRLSDGLYFSQTMRGEIVGGLTVAHPPGTSQGVPSSTRFLTSMARALGTLVPRLRNLGVLRAWSGFYDDTPDGLPVIGEDPQLAGFVHANGFGGHGFMLAPAATRRVAQVAMGEKTDLDPAHFAPGRFQGPQPNATLERLQLG